MTFHDGTTALGTGTISSGIATLATSSLAAGTHSITAQYGGDSNHNAAVSTPISQVVNLAPARHPGFLAEPIDLRCQRDLHNNLPGGATGTVTFYDGTTATRHREASTVASPL